MSQRNPDQILDIFDRMDLENPEERRMCLFLLNDYFGAIFAEVGDQLDFRTSDYGGSISHQWDKASSRLKEVDSVEIEGEYYQTLDTISDLRGDYAHDFRDFPPSEPIASAREITPEWAEWIREAAVEYEEYQESLTATEALVQVGERMLDDMIEDWRTYPEHFSSRAEDLHTRAVELSGDLQSFKDDEDVSKELVEIISDIMEWERDKNEFEDDFESWLQSEQERKEQIDRAENTHNFLVLDEADDFDRLAVMKHDIAEPDTVHTFTVANCPISEDEKEYLRGLDVDDEVRLWIGREMYRNSRGDIDHEDIIREVIDVTEDTSETASAADW